VHRDREVLNPIANQSVNQATELVWKLWVREKSISCIWNKISFHQVPACNQNATEDNINIHSKKIMYNWRYIEAVHGDTSSVEPRESAIQDSCYFILVALQPICEHLPVSSIAPNLTGRFCLHPAQSPSQI